MSFNELELKRIDRTVGEVCCRKTRPEFADQLRFECEIDGNTVSVWEVRPPWDGVGDDPETEDLDPWYSSGWDSSGVRSRGNSDWWSDCWGRVWRSPCRR